MALTFDGEWIKDIQISDLPPAYQEVAEIIGVENAVKLSAHLGGLPFYFPKINGLIERKRNEMIRKDRAAGLDYKEIAKKYHLTEVWTRQICDHQKDDDQLSLLDAANA